MRRSRTFSIAARGGVALLVVAAAVAAVVVGRGHHTGARAASHVVLASSNQASPARSSFLGRRDARAAGSFGPNVGNATFQGLSPTVTSLPPAVPLAGTTVVRDIELLNKGAQPRSPRYDPVVQRTDGPNAPPTPSLSFDGILNMCSCLPPDPNGEVGPNHYVQMVNLHFAVYSKTGTQLAAPRALNQLWTIAGGECSTHNNGDPIVVYDQLANRWVLSQFIASPTGNEQYGECVAVSQTPDPTGAYYLYEFLFGTTTFHDYPHLAMWPDAYYMTTNEFDSGPSGQTSKGAGVFAFERDKMLVGQPARFVYFDLALKNPGGPNSPVDQFIGQQPADLDGLTLPPPGTPAYITEVDDETNIPSAGGVTGDAMRIWKFHVDWSNPALSTLGQTTVGNEGQPNFTLPVNEFVQPVCVYGNGPANHCNPQKNTTYMLDTIGDRLMFRTTYRNFGSHDTLALIHTVSATDPPPATTARNGIRWYEVRNPSGTGGPPTIRQQSTYAPADPANTNPLWRWMGSAAMDKKGDFAVAYSSSGPNDFPSLRFAGRLVNDPLNQLAQGEGVLFQGANSQAFPLGRWGDYSDLTVDPSDDCTFWYTNEYYGGTGIPIVVTAWKTRIASFVYPECLVPTAVRVASFAARRTPAGVRLTWRTTTETEAAGFHVWRATGGKAAWRKVNRTLVAAKRGGRAGGASYSFLDRTARGLRTLTYRLQLVDLAGRRTWYTIGAAPTR